MYSSGEGVFQDDQAALKCYHLAAQGDYPYAQYAQCNLAGAYERGEGVSQDYQQAYKLYRSSAVHGIPESQFNLGNMYSRGKGISQDYQQAYKWYLLAIENGFKTTINGTREHLMEIRQLMLPTQIKKADEFAKKCLQENYKNCD